MTGSLKLDDVTHGVMEAGRRKATLAPISRTFAGGKFHVVGGPSGAGKTTLLSVLSLSVKPWHGAIGWNGHSISEMDAAAKAAWRRDKLGLIFQTSRLVSVMTVAEHIRLAAISRKRPDAFDRGIALLDQFGLSGKLAALPNQLSGGEKQRVAIAQALCFEPPVLLADEPTAALDNANGGLVSATLRTYARASGAVVICVSHDRVVIDAADEVLMLEKPDLARPLPSATNRKEQK
jgi:putative ABC transport system ATP-binding protein